MRETRDQAREIMKGFCRVCPVCDGRACAGEVPGMGGAGNGGSFRDNLRALFEIKLEPRLIHNVENPDTKTGLWGLDLAFPVLAAPMGGVSFNMSEKVPELDYIRAILQGCVRAGVIGSTGDAVPPLPFEAGLTATAEVDGRGIPFIKPWADEELLPKLEQAARVGVKVIGLDIDSIGLMTVRLMGRSIPPRPVERLAEIITRSPLPIVLKGIMSAADARLAVEAGAAGIVVSNHGGRILDSIPGTARVLPSIVREVGRAVPVLVDGGLRSGGDVLKMLALGADAVMIGRPLAVAALGGGAEGVADYLLNIKTELMQAMILTGVPDLSRVDRRILFPSEGAFAGRPQL